MTTYKGIEVYKMQQWTQGPVMLQALNMLENFDLKGMGYNSSRYVHTLYQIMNLAFADRDFYYGDPAFAPEEPMKGLLSKEYAKERIKQINFEKNDAKIMPGDPYPLKAKKIRIPTRSKPGEIFTQPPIAMKMAQVMNL
jgi:gamma-glutamyltranspeptidase/glutathione hydrolase